MATGITHFTSQVAAAAILDGWRRDVIQSDMAGGRSLGPVEVKVRLYSRSGTNDPREQQIAEFGTDITNKKHPKGPGARFRSAFPDEVFMWCGSKPQTGKMGEMANRLEMWRAYGDDGRGVALTTWWDENQLKREGLEILEVEYAPDLKSVTEEIKRLIELQGDDKKSRSERENIRVKRMKLGACHKHCDYKSEEEVRLVCFLGDESGAVRKPGLKEIHLDATSGRLRTYIERPVRLGTTLTGLDITLGPRMTPNDKKHWERVAQWMLAQMGLSGGSVQASKLEYIG